MAVEKLSVMVVLELVERGLYDCQAADRDLWRKGRCRCREVEIQRPFCREVEVSTDRLEV